MQYVADSSTRLSEADVRRLLHPLAVIAAIEGAFRDRFPAVVVAPRQHISIAGGVFLVMSCYDPSRPSLGIKLAAVRTHPAPSQSRVLAT